MQKNLLSVAIPSNRNFDASEDAVRSALGFYRKTACQFVVSDNSQDAKKELELKKMIQGENSLYIKSPPCGMIENWFNAFNATDAEFILMMGDDDTIFRFGESPDFRHLPADVIGIKPFLFAYANPHGIKKMNASPIQAPSAPDRILENLNTSNGTNFGFLSFWRRSVLKSIMELWFLHHPTKGYYCDWAVTNGLISSGKVVLDPATCYFYNLQNWAGDTPAILAQIEKVFLNSGLPPGSSAYAALFNAIDSYIFINRKDSPLPPKERSLSAIFCLDLYLKNYIKNIPRKSVHENAKEIEKLSDRLVGNDSVLSIFALIADIFGAIRPGLDKQYREFHQYAMGKPWGEF